MGQPVVYYRESEEPVSVGDWLLTMIIMAIPIIGFVMLFVWAFGGGKPSKANWAKATLIFMAAMFVLLVGFYALIFLVLIASGSYTSTVQ